MEADFSVELGSDDEVLDLPWSIHMVAFVTTILSTSRNCFRSLKKPVSFRNCAEFLAAINATAKLESAKCDAWFTTDIQPGDSIFGARGKFGGYVDLIFSSSERLSFPAHERLAQQLTKLLKRVPAIPAAAELLIRRCYYRDCGQTTVGFYFTAYLFGYGDDAEQSRQAGPSG